MDNPIRSIRRLVLTSFALAVLLLGGVFLGLYLRAPAPEKAPDAIALPAWPEPPESLNEGWSVFKKRGAAAPVAAGPLAQRYRLAGTFFAYPGDGAGGSGSSRHAIVDDIRAQTQVIVQEEDPLDGCRVLSIFRDRIVLRHATGDEELWLTFLKSGDTEKPTASASKGPAPVLTFDEMPALEVSRFGKRIGDNRWMLEREALMEYFNEVQETPERLSSVLLAMQPEYEGDAVAGFKLDKLGEDVLYDSVGMKNGDVVRMVNSMPMTSPARANYFISEFLNERISAIVLDIEREGVEEKLIYLIR